MPTQESTNVGRDRSVTTVEIRSALFAWLSAPGSAIIEEFPCERGRLDALMVNQALHGFEIKSDFDSLTRVEAQISSFARYCDSITFVAGPRLALKLLNFVPIWCGVVLAHRTAIGVSLVSLRSPKTNARVDALASLTLLAATELHDIARRESRARPKTKNEAVRLLASTLPFTTIRAHLSASLRRRGGAAADERQA